MIGTKTVKLSCGDTPIASIFDVQGKKQSQMLHILFSILMSFSFGSFQANSVEEVKYEKSIEGLDLGDGVLLSVEEESGIF